MNSVEEIGKNLIRCVDVSVGDNHTIVYNLCDVKTVQFDYYEENYMNVEYKDEKFEEDMIKLWKDFRIKK